MAFTHIPLMPAGDVASGVETPRGLGTGNETFSGAAFFSLSLCRKYRFICNTKKKKKIILLKVRRNVTNSLKVIFPDGNKHQVAFQDKEIMNR